MVSIIESLAKVESAQQQLESSVFKMTDIDYSKVVNVLSSLKEIERDLRSALRKDVLAPDPIRVDKDLTERIREQIRKEEGVNLL